MWGQRNTVHLYAADDWPLLHRWIRDYCVVESRLKQAGVGNAFGGLVRYFARRLDDGEYVTLKDAKSFKDYQLIIDARDSWMTSMNVTTSAEWLVGAAAIRRLVRDGIACHGPDNGSETTFVHRRHWLPDLKWTEDENDILATGAQRYLAAYGPGTHKDMAAYFGSTIAEVREWTAAAGDDLIEVDRVGTKCLARAADLKFLTEKPPIGSKWPVRLLHRFDPYVLGAVGSKDKAWLVDAGDIKRVWRPGGHIEAVILNGGRVVGTWRYARRAKGLLFDVKPFRPISQRFRREVTKGAKAIADFLEEDVVGIEVG
jgi:hypothetical protein